MTSTLAAKSLVFHTGGQNNATHLVRGAIKDWAPAYLNIDRIGVGIRDWHRMAKSVGLYEHQVTAQMILDLEKLP